MSDAGRRAPRRPSGRGAARVRGGTWLRPGHVLGRDRRPPGRAEPREPPTPAWKSGPERAPRPAAASPKVAGAGAPRRAGAARRAAARGGLSSGNSLRETEGKTSRGRSAVIGLETDLKGKVGAAVVTAAPLTPARASTLARQPGRLPPLLPRRGGAESRAVRARGGSAHPLTRAPAGTDQYIHSHAHRCTLAQHAQSQHSARTSTVLTRRSHPCKQEYTYTQIVTNSVTLTYKYTILTHTRFALIYANTTTMCASHKNAKPYTVAHYTGTCTHLHAHPDTHINRHKTCTQTHTQTHSH